MHLEKRSHREKVLPTQSLSEPVQRYTITGLGSVPRSKLGCGLVHVETVVWARYFLSDVSSRAALHAALRKLALSCLGKAESKEP